MTDEDVSRRVYVVVTLRIRPGTAAQMLAAFRPVAEATRQEAACVRYELCRSLDDEDRFVLVEEWRDQEGLDAHLKLPHVQALLGVMPEILAEPLAMKMMTAKG